MEPGPRAVVYVPQTPHTNTPPLKPPKKYRDEDTEILRCKRRLDFARLGLPMHRPHPETVAKRNERERKRVKQINVTFNTLKSRLPSALFREKSEKKRSKVDTLRAAISYIRNLQELLQEHDAVAALGGLSATHGLPSPPLGLTSPGLHSPGLQSPGLQSPGLGSQGMQSPGMLSPGMAPPELPSPRAILGHHLPQPGPYPSQDSVSPGSTYSTGSRGSEGDSHPPPLSPEDQDLIQFATEWF